MRKICLSAALMGMSLVGLSENPCVQTCYTTDPAPMVHDGRLYVYTGHDEDNADSFWMQEWRVYSTEDMVNWTDHGSPLAIEDFSWGDDRAWAPQCVERNGKFYFYVPLHSKLSGTMAIGVAVGDTPTGPFKDAIGKPLADGSWDYIDPTCFIDDDGQAYLYWGNPNIYYVRLNDDMVSFDGEVNKLVPDAAGFGPGKEVPAEPGKKYTSSYTEGPWFYKRGGKYYMIYAAGGIPERIAYSMSDSPTGPWKYMGVVMPQNDAMNSFTNHCGTVDYKGKSYFFYHTGNLPGGGGFDRSFCVEPFEYNPDGSIPTILPSREGAPATGTFDPYRRVEAETMAWSEGISTRQNSREGVYVSDVHDGDYLKVAKVDFGNRSLMSFGASAASGRRGGIIEMRIDSVEGPKLAELIVPATGGWENFSYFETPVDTEVSGVHDLYLVFKGRKGPELFNLDYWQLMKQ